MNQYLKNLKKVEFVVTYACTGRCKHCSEGEHATCVVCHSIQTAMFSEETYMSAILWKLSRITLRKGEKI